MFCKHCGKQLSDGSVFCKFCGQRLDAQPQPQQPQQQAWQPPQQPPQQAWQQPPSSPYAPPPAPVRAASGLNHGVLVLSAASLLLVGAIIFGISRLMGGSGGIVGTWVLYEVTAEGVTMTAEELEALSGREIDVSFEFTKDGELIADDGGLGSAGVGTGDYEIDGDQITATIDGDEVTMTLDGDRITLDMEGGQMILAREGTENEPQEEDEDDDAPEPDEEERGEAIAGVEPPSDFEADERFVGLWQEYLGSLNSDNLYEFKEDGTVVHYYLHPVNAAEMDYSREKSIDEVGTYEITGDSVLASFADYRDGEAVGELEEDKFPFEFEEGKLVSNNTDFVRYTGPLWPGDEEAEAGDSGEGTASSSERSVVGMWQSTGRGDGLHIYREDGTYEYYHNSPARALEYGISKEESIFGIGTYTITGNMMHIVYTRYLDGAPSEFIMENDYRLEYAQDGFENAPGIVNEEGFALSGEIFVPYEGPDWP